MQAVSIHAVDVANGLVATGMRVDVLRRELDERGAERWVPLASGKVGGNGVVSGIEGRERLFDVGVYEMRLFIGDYYRARGTPLPEPAFLDVQAFRFGVSDLTQHYHLPVKFSPWGLSCFRGSA